MGIGSIESSILYCIIDMKQKTSQVKTKPVARKGILLEKISRRKTPEYVGEITLTKLSQDRNFWEAYAILEKEVEKLDGFEKGLSGPRVLAYFVNDVFPNVTLTDNWSSRMALREALIAKYVWKVS